VIICKPIKIKEKKNYVGVSFYRNLFFKESKKYVFFIEKNFIEEIFIENLNYRRNF
jgi:hypothetical protein